MLLLTIGLLLFAVGAYAQTCSQALSDIALIAPEQSIAHGIHSLTLNMIQHYFNPNATTANGIHTVNMNRSESNHIHQNAIYVNLTKSIDDYGPFFSLDVILSHMDDENYGIKNTNTLDRIAHGIHMHHMWEQAALLYKEIVANPPDDGTCTCLINTFEEKIAQNVLMIAKLIRIPDEMAAKANEHAKPMRSKTGRRLPYRCRRSIGKGCLDYTTRRTTTRRTTTRRTTTTTRPRYGGHYAGFYGFNRFDEITALRGGSQQRRNIAAKEPTDDLYDTSIESEATWHTWKSYMMEPYPGYTRDSVGRGLAYYMYCHFNAA